jgi:cytoskeletal protein RodZ
MVAKRAAKALNKAMPTVAEQLRTAREAKKLTVQQVADATKIRRDHIGALEEGNFSVFSAPVYIRGSVKIYANHLKLDLPPLMATLDAELRQTEKFSEPPSFGNEAKRPLDQVLFLLARVNLKWVLAILVVLGIVAAVLIGNAVLKRHSKNNSLNNLPPARYEPTNSGNTLPLPKH